MGLPVVHEAFVLGASDLFGESQLAADDDEAQQFEAVCAALWNKPAVRLSGSKLEDAVHLDAHRRNGRDYFVTEDFAMHRKQEALADLGIIVVWPEQAVEIAGGDCGV
jgi:hypothetical protein